MPFKLKQGRRHHIPRQKHELWRCRQGPAVGRRHRPHLVLAPVGIRRVLPTKCSNRNPRWAILTGSPTLSSLAIGHRLRRQGLDNAGDPVGLLRCVRRRCLAGQILCQDFCHRHFSTDSHRHRHLVSIVSGRRHRGQVEDQVAETLPRTTREVGAWIETEYGITYESRSGLIALLHRLGMERKPCRSPMQCIRRMPLGKDDVFSSV